MGPAVRRALPAYVLGGALGGLLGLVGAFLAAAGPLPVGVGTLLAVVGNVLVPYHLGRAAGSVVGAIVPALAWLTVAVYFGVQRPEGDLVLTGELPGLSYLMLGAVAAALIIPRTRSAIAADAERATARAEAARYDADGLSGSGASDTF